MCICVVSFIAWDVGEEEYEGGDWGGYYDDAGKWVDGEEWGQDEEVNWGVGEYGAEIDAGEWTEAIDERGLSNWYNNWTGETTYEDPTEGGGGDEHDGWSEAQWSDDGNAYWYNDFTGETTYEDPRAGAMLVGGGGEGWSEEQWDDEGNLFWFNDQTGETSYENPYDEAIDERGGNGDKQAWVGGEEGGDGEGEAWGEEVAEEEAWDGGEGGDWAVGGEVAEVSEEGAWDEGGGEEWGGESQGAAAWGEGEEVLGEWTAGEEEGGAGGGDWNDAKALRGDDAAEAEQTRVANDGEAQHAFTANY